MPQWDLGTVGAAVNGAQAGRLRHRPAVKAEAAAGAAGVERQQGQLPGEEVEVAVRAAMVMHD